MKSLFIAWQAPDTRFWHTVGRLTRDGGGYQFSYTQGAQASPSFEYLGRMIDKKSVYYSDELFPLFSNRLLDSSRPEYPDYLEWMGIGPEAHEMELLARSGGVRGTDKLCLFPEVEPNERGEVELYFFSHGLRYLNEEEREAVSNLVSGEHLQLTVEHLQLTVEDGNASDSFALLLETAEPQRVGYCPRYLNQGFREVLKRESIQLEVERVNSDAPLQFQLLCKAQFILPAGFDLYGADEYQSLAEGKMAA